MRESNNPFCVHLETIDRGVRPHAAGCEECLAMGETWVHLRLCMTCGHVGCCDDSKNRHATKHFHATKHPIMRSIEPGEEWGWCFVGQGAAAATTLEQFVAQLESPRVIWLMIPAEAVDGVIASLRGLLRSGDMIVDAGNSHYEDDLRRAKLLAADGIHFVDVGTSGGVWGRQRGYCQMIGGEREVVQRLDPIFIALAPLLDAATRTPGRSGPTAAGYLHCGPRGAGHFVKVVHNGIEYGIMAAYAEGMNILRHADAGKAQRDVDAETAPLERPELYQYDFDLPAIAEVWRRGSVIASWLLDLLATSLGSNSDLAQFAGRVSDSGEGRWTLKATIDEGVPAPILATALAQRLSSRGKDDFANRLLAATRFQFGGHEEKRS